MKILKPGKVEMRKFVCPNCGCMFVARPSDIVMHPFDDVEEWAECPECNFLQWWNKGEPYEEPTPTQDVEDDRKRLQDLICEWETCHFGGIPAAAQFFLEHGVTFREG